MQTEVKENPKAILILGMHRSGTSCLAGCLEQCGLFLGEVSRSNQYNLKGNNESHQVNQFHNNILRANNGSWKRPPQSVKTTKQQKKVLEKIVSKLATTGIPFGVKDPRTLLMTDIWIDTLEAPVMIGTFRHPTLVVQSLVNRNNISQNRAYKLWLKYNIEMLILHKIYQFPLINFDISSKELYCQSVDNVATTFGLQSNLDKLRNYVSQDLVKGLPYFPRLPRIYEEVYDYLVENKYCPNSGTYSKSLEQQVEQHRVYLGKHEYKPERELIIKTLTRDYQYKKLLVQHKLDKLLVFVDKIKTVLS